MRYLNRAASILVGTAAIALLTAGCGSPEEEASGGEIVIVCTSCSDHPTDSFQQYRHALAQRFNDEYEGRYRIEFRDEPAQGPDEQAQAYRRLALAGDLPDLFIQPKTVVSELAESVDLVDFEELLAADPAFAESFHDGIIDVARLDSGELFLVPEQRDVAGVFWNTDALDAAGITEPPSSWEGLTTAAAALKDNGHIPIAVDGLWVTQLWLSHFVGTQPGGADYLNSGRILDGGFADEPLWRNAVEALRDLHTEGYVNSDAFTGDFEQANAVYQTGEAASIVNGPWQLDLIEDPAVLDATLSVPAPGDGVAVIGGAIGWANAATSAEKQEAVFEFIKYAYTWDEQVNRTIATGSFPPVKGEFSDEQRSELSGTNVDLAEASASIENTYPAIIGLLPQSFSDAWSNYWPAYVQGVEDTDQFLERLSQSIQ